MLSLVLGSLESHACIVQESAKNLREVYTQSDSFLSGISSIDFQSLWQLQILSADS